MSLNHHPRPSGAPAAAAPPCLPILKDWFLIIRPEATWNGIVAGPSGAGHVFLKYLLPLLVLVAVVEGHGLILMGRHQLAAGLANHFPLTRVCLFELAQAGLLLLLLLGAAVFIKSFGNACHRRNHLSQGLFLVFHAVGPLLLLQLFNGLPIMNLFWVSWLVGITLTLCTLYHGLPRIMRPDPPSAMGLFLASSCVLCLLLFGARLFTYCYLARQLNASGAIFSGLPM